MAEASKRGLRERPRRRNFDSENDEGQGYGYGKSYAKDFVNPSQQLNQEAKLLLRFVNAANRSYHDAQQLKLHTQNEAARTTQATSAKGGKREEGRENGKKVSEGGKGEVQARRGKQAGSSNGQNKSYQKINNNKEDFLSKIKGMALASASTMLELEKTLGKNHSNASLPSKKPQQTQPANRSRPDFVVRGKEKGEKEERAGSKFQLMEQKIFKRSAYHVAIAYHIFLTQKSKGGESVSYDPTYHARRLKEQMSKRAQ